MPQECRRGECRCRQRDCANTVSRGQKPILELICHRMCSLHWKASSLPASCTGRAAFSVWSRGAARLKHWRQSPPRQPLCPYNAWARPVAVGRSFVAAGPSGPGFDGQPQSTVSTRSVGCPRVHLQLLIDRIPDSHRRDHAGDPLRPEHQPHPGVSSFHRSCSSGMAGAGLTAPVVDRFGRRLTMIVSLSVVSAALLAFCIAPSVILTLMACAAFGFAGPFALVLTQAELLDRQIYHRATAMAELNMVVSAALVAAALGVGPLVALTDSWRIALMLPVAATLGTFIALRGLRFSERPARGPRSKRRMTGLAWLFCLILICSTAFEWSYGSRAPSS